MKVALYLHLLAMAFFVGGQFVLAFAIVPVARGTDYIRPIARRFGYGTLVALAVLIATGSWLASHTHRWSDGTLQVKLALVALAALLVGLHIRRPAWHVLDAAIFLVTLVIVWLGVTLVTG